MTPESIPCHQFDHSPVFFHLQGPNIAAIVAPTVTLGVLAIVLAVLAWLLCVVKKRRQTEGTYRPSAEEQSGAHGVAAPDALKLPKEERLIWDVVHTGCEHLHISAPVWRGSLPGADQWQKHLHRFKRGQIAKFEAPHDAFTYHFHFNKHWTLPMALWRDAPGCMELISGTIEHFKEFLNISSAQMKQELPPLIIIVYRDVFFSCLNVPCTYLIQSIMKYFYLKLFESLDESIAF